MLVYLIAETDCQAACVLKSFWLSERSYLYPQQPDESPSQIYVRTTLQQLHAAWVLVKN